MDSQDDKIRNKAVGLFTYLKKIAELRSKPVCKLDSYEKVIWFSEIPREKECFTPAWGETKSGQEDIWLGIRKVNFLRPPYVPTSVVPWVHGPDLLKSDDIPKLKDKILVPAADKKPESPSDYVELTNCPDIIEKWEKYLEEKWLPWAEENERLLKIQSVYSKLHSIYQLQKTLGETFELVVGFGLLTWRSPANEYKRHIITAQALIELDTKHGTLYLKQGAEGAKLNLEQDMLEPSERCTLDVANSIGQTISEIADEVWDIPAVETVLKTWMHSVSAEASYSTGLLSPSELTQKVTITYAPAIILRNRRHLKLVETFDKIIAQIKADGKIPFGVRRIVEITDDFHSDDSESSSQNGNCDFQEILFPKPSNDEQKRIVEYLRSRQGVLVQGPPGTGKSHTIVNLLCHLLATGKRVLVTSQTPRALKVIRSLMPREVAPLCVNVLGNDKDSLQSLKDSVEGIVHRKFDWDENPGRNQALIPQLQSQLELLKRQKADLLRKLHEIREKETYQYRLCDGTYSGTSQQIAQEVASQESKHGWLNIVAEEGEPCPLSNNEALQLVHLYQSISEIEANELLKKLPSPDQLLTPESFSRFCQAEKTAQANNEIFSQIKQNPIFCLLKNAPSEALSYLKSQLQSFVSIWSGLSKHRQPWVLSMVDDVVSERDRRWRYLLSETQNCLENLRVYEEQLDKCSLKIDVGKDRSVVKADAEALLAHFENGGKVKKFVVFRPDVVKKSLYLTTDTYVDGRLCDNPETLNKLLLLVKSDEHLDGIWNEWSVCVARSNGSRRSQLRDLEDLCEPLSDAMNLHSQMGAAREACSKIPGLTAPVWHLFEEVEAYLKLIEAAEAERSVAEITAVFDRLLDELRVYSLHSSEHHPLTGELLEAICSRDDTAYLALDKKIEAVIHKREALTYRKQLFTCLVASPARAIAEEFTSDPHNHCWQERMSCFSESWRWAQARTWLINYIGSLNEQTVSSELDYVEMQISNTTSILAAEMAWRHCFSRLKEEERLHLMSWANETRQVGKGTGKKAEEHRRNAREHMQKCRTAIPAWVMPLYRVAETVEPGTDLFDVVIIDEASQSGPEALFLQFIAKQIVVVGDEKQISPLSIGIQLQQVDWLRQQYIAEIPCKNALGTESSFFDLAGILFSGRIVLREHFRCMPEIIQFSNSQFYSATPLVPLRQYPPKCLEPVKTVYVANGYRDGGTRTPRNLPEAEAIVQTIKDCCSNPEYDGKSIGVISLLNEYQARKIDELLLAAIGSEEMAKRNIICGDAYAFQGDERDIMFLSMVAAPSGSSGTSLSALTAPEAQRRFNVAASRARDQMWLFHTPTLNDFGNHECLRYRLLEYCQNYKRKIVGVDCDIQQLRASALNRANRIKYESPGKCNSQWAKYFDSWFEVDVFLRIVDKGYQVVPQFEVANYRIDLMVQGATKELAVECDGDRWHSEPEQRERDILRERMLKRCGRTFWRIRGGEFYFNPSKALDPLWEKLAEIGIAPGGKDIVQLPDITPQPVQSSNDNSDNVPDNETVFANNDNTDSLNGSKHFQPQELKDAILSVLKQCPNNSCTKKSLTQRVCRYLNVITRGKPRDKFEHKLLKALEELKKSYIVEEYTATNVRIRLIREAW